MAANRSSSSGTKVVALLEHFKGEGGLISRSSSRNLAASCKRELRKIHSKCRFT